MDLAVLLKGLQGENSGLSIVATTPDTPITLGAGNDGVRVSAADLASLNVPALVIGSDGGSNPIAMNGGDGGLDVNVPLVILAQGAGGHISVSCTVKVLELQIFGPGNTTELVDGTDLNVVTNFYIDDSLAVHGSARRTSGDDLTVTGRIPGGVGDVDILQLNAQGAITVGGAIGRGIATVVQTSSDTYTDGVYEAMPVLGGSGKGATATVTVVGGEVTDVSLVNNGAGYAIGDTLRISAVSLGGASGDAPLTLEVTDLADLEGLTVLNATDVSFAGPIYIDGDLTIQASGLVVFGDRVVLRNGANLVIEGATEVIFANGTQTDSGGIRLSSESFALNALNGLSVGNQGAFNLQGMTEVVLTPVIEGQRQRNLTGADAVLNDTLDISASVRWSVDSLSLSDAAVLRTTGELDITTGALSLGAEARVVSISYTSVQAQTIHGESGALFSAEHLSLHAEQDIGTEQSPLSIEAAQVSARSDSGAIYLDAQGDVFIGGEGLVVTSGDGPVVLSALSGAIQGASSELDPHIATAGQAVLAARDGVGAVGEGRLRVDVGSVSVSNTNSGHIVLSSLDDLVLGEQGVSNTAPEGWVALFSEHGEITGGAAVAASKHVALVTGVATMSQDALQALYASQSTATHTGTESGTGTGKATAGQGVLRKAFTQQWAMREALSNVSSTARQGVSDSVVAAAARSTTPWSHDGIASGLGSTFASTMHTSALLASAMASVFAGRSDWGSDDSLAASIWFPQSERSVDAGQAQRGDVAATDSEGDTVSQRQPTVSADGRDGAVESAAPVTDGQAPAKPATDAPAPQPEDQKSEEQQSTLTQPQAAGPTGVSSAWSSFMAMVNSWLDSQTVGGESAQADDDAR